MSRLLCLKNVALRCVSVSFKLVFHWMIRRTTVLAAIRVVVFRGKACLSGSNTSQMLVLFLKYCLCPTPSLCCHVGLRCLNLISFLTQSSHQQAAKDYKTEEHWGSLQTRNGPDSEKERSSEDFRLHALPVPEEETLLKDNVSPAPPKFNLIFFFFYMYELYSVCASLLCETQKDETKQKRWQKHYREDKNSMLVEFWSHHLSCLFFLVANYWK